MTVDIATLAIRIDSLEAQNATRELDRMRRAGGQAESATDSLADAFKRFAGPAAAVAAILATLKKTLEIQRQFDSLNASLITATGSAGNAAQAFKALQSFAATTPYGLAEVTKAFIQMRNMGLDPSEAALRSYGNTASAMGKSLEQMVGAVADAATGEFERLKEFGIKSKIQGDQVRFTFQGASTLVGNSAREIEDYLKMLGDTNFAGGMELQANTLNGAISNLGDAWDQTFLTIAQSGIGDAMQSGVLGASGALADLTAIIDSMSGAIDENGKKVEEASVLHRAITTVFETVAVIGLNVAYVFTQVGKEMAGLAAQAKAVATGDFAGAKAIGVMMRAEAEEDRKMVDAKTEKILWAASIATRVRENEVAAKSAARRDDLAQFKVEQAAAGLSAAEMAKRAQAAKKEAEAYASLITSIRTKTEENRLELAVGQSATESQKIQINMDQELASGKLKLSAAHLAAAQAALVALGVTEQQLKADAAQREVTKYIAESTAARDKDSASLAVQYEMYGKTADARELAMVAVQAEAWKEAALAKLRAEQKPITDQIINQLNAEAKARTLVGEAALGQGKALEYASQLAEENKRFGLEYIMDDKARAAATLKLDDEVWQQRIKLAGDGTEAQKLLQDQYTVWYRNQAIKPQLDEQKNMWASVERTAHDTFISIFDSGKSAFNRLRDTLKNGLLDLLYQMTVKKWIFNIGASVTGSGVAGVAQAAAGGGSAIGTAGNLGSLLTGGSALAGGMAGNLGTGFIGSVYGGMTGAGAGSGLTSAAGLAIGEGLGAVGSALMTAAPYLAAIAGAYMLWKKLDTSGTYHTGGAASASSAGVNTIRAESLNFEATRNNADTEKMVSQLASGIVGILDSTALAFGKTAGYTAATAFADDTSKDGAWGGLVISKLGDKLIDWQDSRGNGAWAPKVFADGAEGQKQYLAALGSSVRTALDGIGLPDWAKKMLDGLGKDAGLDEMAKVVEAINSTQVALKAMGDQLVGFSSLSESAVSALMAAAGGIQNLATGASAYYDNFYSDAEKNANAIKQIDDAIHAVGLAVPTSIKEFRALVEAQMKLGEAGAPAVAALFKVAGAFAQTHPAIDATTDSLQAMKDAAGGLLGDVDNAFSVLQRVTEASIKPLQARIDKERALSDAIRSTLDGMKVQGAEMADRASAQAQIRAALAIAKSGGALPDADALKKALSAVTQDASSQFATQQDYLRDFYQTQNDIEALGNLADSALSVDEKSLSALTSMLDVQQQIVDKLNGIDITGLTIADALAGFKTAVGSAQANPIVSATSGISGLYQSLLGRAPDAAGLDYWKDKAAGGMSMDAIAKFIKESGEYKKLRGFAVGTNYVPATMPALIHEGERIIPAADNRALMARLSSPSESNAALVAEVRALRDEVILLRKANSEENFSIAKHAMNAASALDDAINGDKPLATKVVPA